MPVKTSNNNNVLANNVRQSDVAKRAIQEVLGAQQIRSQAAFRVQGFEGVLYNRLYQGIKCTCESTQKHLATRLDDSGKAKPGMLNELLTGAVFDVSAYGRSKPAPGFFESETSPQALNKHQGVFDNVGIEPSAQPTRIPDGRDYGDNGPVDLNFDIDDLASDFDASRAGFNEVSCAVCFGSGFVGGYTPLYGRRIVKTVDTVQLASTDAIDARYQPWRANSLKFSFVETLPLGAVAVDVCRVMSDHRPVLANFKIDGQPINEVLILRFCDGRPHVFEVTFPQETTFTHVEIQFKTSVDDAFFEFPKLTKSQDLSLLETTEPFQIVLSPLVPFVQQEDLFTDSTYGKTLIVENVNTWNTRNRQALGWECQVRVVQPQEFYNVMPRRGRIKTKNETPNLVHDNSTGYRRT